MLTLLPKGVQTKKLKLFDWRFFPFATGLNDTSSASWAAKISAKFLKIRNVPNGLLRALGETDSWKNLKSTISWQCPFKFQKILMIAKTTRGTRRVQRNGTVQKEYRNRWFKKLFCKTKYKNFTSKATPNKQQEWWMNKENKSISSRIEEIKTSIILGYLQNCFYTGIPGFH